MGDVANLRVNLDAATADFKIALDKASDQLQSFGKKSEGMLSQLKQSFGRGSALMSNLRFAFTGGAIGLIARELEQVTAKASELAQKFREGKVSGSEMAQGIAESIPVLGAIVKSGASINNLITGSADLLKSANAEADQMVALTDRIRAGFEKSAEAIVAMKERLAEIRMERAKDDAGPFDKKVIDVVEKTSREIKTDIDTGHKQVETILNPKGGKTFDELTAQRKDLDRQIAAAKSDVDSAAADYNSKYPSDAGNAHRRHIYQPLDVAQKRLDSLQEQRAPVAREIDARQKQAAPIQDLEWKAILQSARLGGHEYLKIWEDIGTKTTHEFESAWAKRQAKDKAAWAGMLKYLDKVKEDFKDKLKSNWMAFLNPDTKDGVTGVINSGLKWLGIRDPHQNFPDQDKRIDRDGILSRLGEMMAPQGGTFDTRMAGLALGGGTQAQMAAAIVQISQNVGMIRTKIYSTNGNGPTFGP